MIGIIDYGMGNLRSVHSALDMLGARVQICTDPGMLEKVDRIILPGVGAFRDCINSLDASGFVKALNYVVRQQRKPILGICLGMQVMTRQSIEGGRHQGLGWIDADVVALEPRDNSLRVPQIGWNDIQYDSRYALFKSLPPAPDFYFAHSYALNCDHGDDVIATCNYGGLVTAAICKHNILATQFHPEKSQDHGLRILQNFMDWNPEC